MPNVKQSPGWQAVASPNSICSAMHTASTARDLQAQMIEGRFGLPGSAARAIAGLCFGEAGDEG
jgi:hypothetical protein